MKRFFLKVQETINKVGDFIMIGIAKLMAAFWIVFIFSLFYYGIYKLVKIFL